MRLLSLGITAATIAVVPTATAAQQTSADDWQLGAEVYFWGASLGGETTSGDDIDVGIDKIIENLNFGLMGAVAARRGPWTLFADVIYLDLEDDQSTTANIVGTPIEVDADVELRGIVSTLGGGYRLYDGPGASLDGIAGARVLWLDADLDFDVGPLGASVSDSKTAIDAVVGLRGTFDLSDRWYVGYYGDIGAGESDLTWQALAGVNYRLARADLALGYRYISWALNDFDPLDELDLHGPFAGAKFPF